MWSERYVYLDPRFRYYTRASDVQVQNHYSLIPIFTAIYKIFIFCNFQGALIKIVLKCLSQWTVTRHDEMNVSFYYIWHRSLKNFEEFYVLKYSSYTYLLKYDLIPKHISRSTKYIVNTNLAVVWTKQVLDYHFIS